MSKVVVITIRESDDLKMVLEGKLFAALRQCGLENETEHGTILHNAQHHSQWLTDFQIIVQDFIPEVGHQRRVTAHCNLYIHGTTLIYVVS